MEKGFYIFLCKISRSAASTFIHNCAWSDAGNALSCKPGEILGVITKRHRCVELSKTVRMDQKGFILETVISH